MTDMRTRRTKFTRRMAQAILFATIALAGGNAQAQCGDCDYDNGLECLTVTRTGPCCLRWVRGYAEEGQPTGIMNLPGTPMSIICCNEGTDSCGPTTAAWTNTISSTASMSYMVGVKISAGVPGSGVEGMSQTTAGFQYTVSQTQSFSATGSASAGTIRVVTVRLEAKPLRAVIEACTSRDMTVLNTCLTPPRPIVVECGRSMHRTFGAWNDSYTTTRQDEVLSCEDCFDETTGRVNPDCLDNDVEPF